MKWTCKGAIANISGMIITFTMNNLKVASPFIASLIGGAVEGFVDGIDMIKKQRPEQNLENIIQNAIRRALNEVRQSYPFELSVDCENAVINGAFSVDNAIRYMKAADREKVFEETVLHIISMYSECDVTTIPIKQITACIVDHVEDGLLKDSYYLTLCNYRFSQAILHEIEKIEAILGKNNAFSYDGRRIRERSIHLLQEYRLSVRFSYYNQCIDASIVPEIATDEGFITISELIPWLEHQGINRVQLIGEGGMGKTSFLLSLWDYLVTNGQYANYLVNMIKLNRINTKSKEDADKFLLTEFAKKFLFDDIYLTEGQINDALKMLSMAECRSDGWKYILLLDGCNEIRSIYQMTFIHQLNELACYQNMIIILTSRFELRPQHLVYDFFPMWISRLDNDTIFAYLRKYTKAIPKSFYHLLDNPMMLTVYCETCQLRQENGDSRFFSFPDEIENKYDLMRVFFEGLVCKEYNHDGNLDSLVQNLFIYNYVLPYIAIQMDERYHYSYQNVKDCIKTICSDGQLRNPVINAMFCERDLEQQWDAFMKQPNLCHTVRKYLLENPTVFIGDDSREVTEGWTFIHQEYRDYCKLKYGAICLGRILQEEGFPIQMQEAQLISVIIKIRKKLWSYPNRYWKEELENMPARDRIQEENAVRFISDSANICAVMKVVFHYGFRQLARMNEAAKGQLSEKLRRELLLKARTDFLCLIDCMDLQSALVGTSNLKEIYLNGLFRLERKRSQVGCVDERYYRELKAAVDHLMAQMKCNEVNADFDIQLPTEKQLVDAENFDNHATPYKIIISCRGQYGRLYTALGIVYESYHIIPGTFADYVSVPKHNGYRALHMTISLDSGMLVMVIIRQTRKLRKKI